MYVFCKLIRYNLQLGSSSQILPLFLKAMEVLLRLSITLHICMYIHMYNFWLEKYDVFSTILAKHSVLIFG